MVAPDGGGPNPSSEDASARDEPEYESPEHGTDGADASGASVDDDTRAREAATPSSDDSRPAGETATSVEPDADRASAATAGGTTAGAGAATVGAGGGTAGATDLPVPEAVARRRVERLDEFAALLDSAVRVPGTDYRVGLDPILGIVPGGGDAVAALLSLVVVVEGYRLGAPASTLGRMGVNVVIDAAIGSVPVVGDLFDAAWKANERNVRLLERHVDERASASG